MVEPTHEVWVHGLLPLAGACVNETSLKALLEKAKPKDLKLGLDQWRLLGGEALGLSEAQADASVRLCFVLSQPTDAPLPMPGDEALRVPLGSLLLLLWVQWAHHELGESCATNVHRAQAASGEVWPSLVRPPAAAASAVLLEGGAQPSARSLAVQSRVHSADKIRRRRKLLQASLATLVQLVGCGAERLYATEFDRLALLLRPDEATTARLIARGLQPGSLSASLGLFAGNPSAALPVGALVAGLRGALVEVAKAAVPAPAPTKGATASPPVPAQASGRSPLSAAPSASANAPGEANGGRTGSPNLALTPGQLPGGGSPSGRTPPAGLRLSVSTSDTEDQRPETSPTRGTLLVSAETSSAPGAGVLRLQGAKKRTICLRDKDLNGGSLQLIDCHGCFIYVLGPLRGAELLGCRSCTIVLGAVAGVVSAGHCASLKLVATAKALRVANCHESSLFLCVNSPPLIFGENPKLQLAPFPTVYAGLADHMVQSQLSPLLSHNFWNAPAIPTAAPATAMAPAPAAVGRTDPSAAAGASVGTTTPRFTLLPPARFLPFHVPMDIPSAAAHGEGIAPPCELPTEYSTALLGHVQRLARFRDELQTLSCSEDIRREVQATVNAGFHQWLQRTGHMRHLNDLAAQQTW